MFSDNTNSILSQFFEVSSSPFSIIFLIVFGVLCTSLVIAIFSKRFTKSLQKYGILEENETPQSFLLWIMSIVITIRAVQVFIAQPFLVDGASMYPTFQDNNLLIVDKTYKHRTLSRNDVIVFKFINEDSPYSGRYFIKRLIGLPGDTVVINGTSTIITDKDGKTITLEEGYVKYPKLIQKGKQRLGDDEYFVMGDNRDGSYDSRAWGPVRSYQIAGEPVLQLYPRIGIYPGRVENIAK